MLQADIERECRAIYGAAGFSADEPRPVGRLARALLGSGVGFAPMIRGREGELCTVHGRPRIFVRRGIAPSRARWVACHELAHWWIRSRGISTRNEETACDGLGAAIVAPRAAVLVAHRLTPAIPRLAEAFATMQGLLLLRLGECEGVPVALIGPTGVRTRGEPYPWPAKMRPSRIPHSVPARVVWITDAPRRVALIVA